MAWEGSRRRDELPKDWKRIRRVVMERARGLCERCGGRATDVHHLGDRHDHRPEVLQAICGECHRRITAIEANAAKPSRLRPPEPHPGALR